MTFRAFRVLRPSRVSRSFREATHDLGDVVLKGFRVWKDWGLFRAVTNNSWFVGFRVLGVSGQ